MKRHAPLIAEMRVMLALGLPLAGGHLAHFAVGVADVVMMGWYGVAPLAAVVLGSTFLHLVFYFGSGFANAVLPMVAKAAAAGDETELRRVTRMGLWISLAYGLLTFPLFWWSGPILRVLGQPDALAVDAQIYLRIIGFQMAPALLFMVLRSSMAGLERTRVTFWVTAFGTVVNVVLNWVLIFGKLGLPELGIAGCALASLVANLSMLAIMAVYSARARGLRQLQLFHRIWRADMQALTRVFVLGLPIGVTILAEVGLFVLAALMFGWIGTRELAAHGIVMQLAVATFLIQLGLSNAATVRAGHALGRGDRVALGRSAGAVLGLSLIFAITAATLFITLPDRLLGPFLRSDLPDRAAILAIASQLLVLAGLFQIADAMQVVLQGLLRGLQDTKVPMILAAIGYCAIGIPISYGLAFPAGLDGPGIWAGLAAGLMVTALMLGARFAYLLRTAMPGMAAKTL